MAIPRIVHTCWFGDGKRSKLIDECLETHRALMPGYTFMEWNEKTTDMEEYPFLARAYKGRNYAHLSDMVRLLALHRHGGIYLDTDVKVIRSFDPLLEANFLCGYIWDCMLGTAVIGSAPGHPIVGALLDPYISSQDDICFNLANNHMLTRLFRDRIDGFSLTGREWRRGGIHVLDRFAFEQPSLGLRRNYSVHHAAASWRSQSAATRRLKKIAATMMGFYLYRRYNCWSSLRRSAFRIDHERALMELHLRGMGEIAPRALENRPV